MVFDRDTPGDRGYRCPLTETQQKELQALLQPQDWIPAKDLPEMGISPLLAAVNEARDCGLAVSQWEEKTLVWLSREDAGENGGTEAYFAPEEVAGAATAFGEPFYRQLTSQAQQSVPQTIAAQRIDAVWQSSPYPSSNIPVMVWGDARSADKMAYLEEVREKVANSPSIRLQCADIPSDNSGYAMTLSESTARQLIELLLKAQARPYSEVPGNPPTGGGWECYLQLEDGFACAFFSNGTSLSLSRSDSDTGYVYGGEGYGEVGELLWKISSQEEGVEQKVPLDTTAVATGFGGSYRSQALGIELDLAEAWKDNYTPQEEQYELFAGSFAPRLQLYYKEDSNAPILTFFALTPEQKQSMEGNGPFGNKVTESGGLTIYEFYADREPYPECRTADNALFTKILKSGYEIKAIS
ncbi:MAG: hypothetical protein PHD67_04855 [Oscillospiraceae bacterium]|nr:hypothetical protein [Oscillospiraceae bacterium]